MSDPVPERILTVALEGGDVATLEEGVAVTNGVRAVLTDLTEQVEALPSLNGTRRDEAWVSRDAVLTILKGES